MGLFADTASASGLTPPVEQIVDGDTASLNLVYSEESLEEIKKLLNSTTAYVDPRGGLMASSSVATVELVLKNMTG